MKKTFIILSALLLSSTPAFAFSHHVPQERINRICKNVAGLKGLAAQDKSLKMGMAFSKDKRKGQANLRAAYNQCPNAFNVYPWGSPILQILNTTYRAPRKKMSDSQILDALGGCVPSQVNPGSC